MRFPFRTHPNGAESDYNYDAAGRMTYLNTYCWPANDGILLQRYGYDVRDRRTRQTRNDQYGDSWRYQDDNQLLQQRTDVWRPDVYFENPGSFTDTFAYDAAGNRTSWNENGAVTTYTADDLNQYSSVTGLTIQHGDNRGNITKLGAWTFYYDADNRLNRAQAPAATFVPTTTRSGSKRLGPEIVGNVAGDVIQNTVQAAAVAGGRN